MKDIFGEILKNPLFPEGTAWTRLKFKAGEMIVQKGEIGKTLFLVEEGNVRVLGGAELEGNRKISPGLCDLQPGAIFGDVCLYGTHQRSASVMALNDVCVLEIDSGMLSIYLDEHPAQGYPFLKALFQIMSKRLALANDRIEYLLAWGIKAHDIDKYL
jgi:CRP/FNR family transcriptional regulator, cyclic AMP receptor protein